MIQMFSELTEAQLALAGGKGGVLAKLYQEGYPVPNGFVILPNAFDGEGLKSEAWSLVQAQLTQMRRVGKDVSFAVRSSALSEDSAQASFGGQFETVLDVHTDEAIREAIQTVYDSRHGERVRAYVEAKGLEISEDIAVVVQQLMRSDIAGVLFTADPVTGSRNVMTSSYIYGLGDRLVSGEVDAEAFTLERPKGQYDGPAALKRSARKLYKLAARLERDLGGPQDIEWTIAGGRLYILQSRPITTLIGYDPTTGEHNASLTADYLWSNQMTAEVFNEVMTPASQSVWEILFERMGMGAIPTIGNIGGRIYMNVSAAYSVIAKFMKGDKAKAYLESMGGAPDGMEIPLIPLTLRTILVDIAMTQLPIEMNKQKLEKKRAEFIGQAPRRCQELRRRIQNAGDGSLLIDLWRDEIIPSLIGTHALQDTSNEKAWGTHVALKTALAKLLDEAETLALISTISASAEHLASLGPAADIGKVALGEMSREAYEEHYGHRGPYENYLEIPRLSENANWIDERIRDSEQSLVDVEELLAKRRTDFEAAWETFQTRFPGQARDVRKKIDKVTETAREREAVRTELTRVLGLMRTWFLRAGELIGLREEDVFFLTYQEMMEALSGDDSAAAAIPTRRATYERYKALPPYPSFIRGRFDPSKWAADPNRRTDAYDAFTPVPMSDTDTVRGYAGSAGRVEGFVRRIDRPEDGDRLQVGEILVARTTNIGWTPIFPKAAAVVTDIGAPLAHATIVARELGIPAVVGCRNATMLLKTGDRVMVDGGQGIVTILEKAHS